MPQRGGVGSILVQLAKRAGAKTTIAGTSTAELPFARSLGADLGVDYTRSGWGARRREKLDQISSINRLAE